MDDYKLQPKRNPDAIVGVVCIASAIAFALMVWMGAV